MARSLSQSVLSFRLITKPHPSSSRLLAVRTQSNQPNPSDSSDSSSDPLLRKLKTPSTGSSFAVPLPIGSLSSPDPLTGSRRPRPNLTALPSSLRNWQTR
ncbi:hypothetical protein ES288_A06G144100v1 [Gossypium darwinii]|uniref:Uncharacterized protein n=1 Tax=Gossypium darwinii TaxID=34276 RepID=A0A5D2G643_GOSDA|nr:hypothetical protein ES288_A06G144100v1 [Gossypium darwinii]